MIFPSSMMLLFRRFLSNHLLTYSRLYAPSTLSESYRMSASGAAQTVLADFGIKAECFAPPIQYHLSGL
jgi:hypothetical protein